MSKFKTKDKDMHVYYPSRVMGWLAVGFFVLYAVYMAFSVRAFLADDVMAFSLVLRIPPLVVIGVLVWVAIIDYFQSKLIFHDDALELVRGNSRVLVPYSLMAHIHIKQQTLPSVSILLNKTVEPETSGLVEQMIYGNSINFVPIGNFIHPTGVGLLSWIPTSISLNQFKSSDLADLFYKYAPHIFEDKEKTS